MPLSLLVLVLIAVTLGSFGQVAMKFGMNLAHGMSIFRAIFTPYVFTGFALYGISSMFWLMVLKKAGELSYVYPMIAISYIFVAILSYFIFKDTLSWQRWLGITLICVGVYFVAASPSKAHHVQVPQGAIQAVATQETPTAKP